MLKICRRETPLNAALKIVFHVERNCRAGWQRARALLADEGGAREPGLDGAGVAASVSAVAVPIIADFTHICFFHAVATVLGARVH